MVSKISICDLLFTGQKPLPELARFHNKVDEFDSQLDNNVGGKKLAELQSARKRNVSVNYFTEDKMSPSEKINMIGKPMK